MLNLQEGTKYGRNTSVIFTASTTRTGQRGAQPSLFFRQHKPALVTSGEAQTPEHSCIPTSASVATLSSQKYRVSPAWQSRVSNMTERSWGLGCGEKREKLQDDDGGWMSTVSSRRKSVKWTKPEEVSSNNWASTVTLTIY